MLHGFPDPHAQDVLDDLPGRGHGRSVAGGAAIPVAASLPSQGYVDF